MENGLQFDELGGDSSDDSIAAATVATSSKRDTPSLLPPEYTRKLVEKLKSLTGLWAKEEQEMGHQVFCKYIVGLFRSLDTCDVFTVLTDMNGCRLAYHDNRHHEDYRKQCAHDKGRALCAGSPWRKAFR